MGVESYLVAATVLGIIAQRLVRVVCDRCAIDVDPDRDVLARVAAGQSPVASPRFRRGRGCDDCAGTGYRGRTGLYELMPMTPDLREAVVGQAPLSELRALATARGMGSLRAAGWAKACTGETTLEEVLRTTRDEMLE
jgi:type II secretory ATPase GspE/PulE/Tfp pilus assembly ATPase PilB-like protein